MSNYDLVVVGASFAGLACAESAAREGLKTLVMDKKRAAGASTQSTGIFVKEIAESISIPQKLCRKIAGIRLYAPNMQFVDLLSPDYYFLATDTEKVLDWMASQTAAQGAKFTYGSAVRRIDVRSSHMAINDEVRASYLVGADGAKSTVAQQLGLGRNKKFLLGTECEVALTAAVHPEFMHVFLDPQLAPGYIGWIVPGVNHLQIGLAGRLPHKVALAPFLKKLSRFFKAEFTIHKKRSGLIPCGGLVSNWYSRRACLLGDAAGMVSPLTAGGIHPAIAAGEKLGHAIADYLCDGGEHPAEQIANHIPRYRMKKQLRRLADLIPQPEFLLNEAIGNPVFQRMAKIIFFHHRGLFSKAAWREILLG